MINWKPIQTKEEAKNAFENSQNAWIMFFKHSTTCGISAAAKYELDQNWDLENIQTFYVDLLVFREVSNYIAELTGVIHQSPQVILIKDKKARQMFSHYAIKVSKIKEVVDN
ncbi:MAG: bacillithiol system redox-active protein YtxJ [Flavobacteriaceae bacterium]|nr:MAG: bacillithiol system redox-active protein YtxJ [Flavobacteriaceae bacterium]